MGAAVGGADRRQASRQNGPRAHGPRHVGPRSQTGLTEAELEAAAEMKRQGLSYRRIGEALGKGAAQVEYNLSTKHQRYPKPMPLAVADRDPRHPIDAALAVLGWRAAVGRRGAVLDGRPASLVQLVQAANDALAAAGRAPIVYPGVNPRVGSAAGLGRRS